MKYVHSLHYTHEEHNKSACVQLDGRKQVVYEVVSLPLFFPPIFIHPHGSLGA